MNKITFKSRKDVSEFLLTKGIDTSDWSEVKWLKLNKGQAEIHMMALAEAMWDAMNDSRPEKLMPGDWHIPFKNQLDLNQLTEAQKLLENPLDRTLAGIKISTAMAARTSYTVVGDEKEISYDKLIEIHDKMANQVPFHASPFEHCAQAMDSDEYEMYIKGEGTIRDFIKGFRNNKNGWCRNYRGFIQYRHKIEKV